MTKNTCNKKNVVLFVLKKFAFNPKKLYNLRINTRCKTLVSLKMKYL